MASGSRALTVLVLVAVVISVELGARTLSPWFHDEFEGWGSGDVAAKAAHIEHVARQGGADVVVTGTSQVYWGINGQVVANAMGRPEATVYNAGLLGGTPLLQRQWLLRTVVPALEPKVVVWGVSMLDFAVDNPVMSGPADTFLSSQNGAPGLGPALNRWFGEHLAIVRHRRQLASPQQVFAAANRMRNGETPGRLDGASIDRLTPSGSPLPPLVRQMDWSVREVDRTLDLLASGFENSAAQREAMIETINTLHDDGIEVVLAVMPASRLYVDLQFGEGGALHPFYEAVAAVANETGTPVLDLQASGTPDGLFADAVHLNGDGAIAISRLLGLLLQDPNRQVDELKRALIAGQGLDVATGRAPGIPPAVPTEPEVIEVLERLGWQREQADGPLVPPPAVIDDLPELVVVPTPLLPPIDEPAPGSPTEPLPLPSDTTPTELPTGPDPPVPVEEATVPDLDARHDPDSDHVEVLP